MWDAVLGGYPAAICRYCKGYRQQNAPRSPRPSGLWPGRHAEGGAVPAPVGVGATPERAKRAGLNPRAYARLCGRLPASGAPAQRSGAPSALLPGLAISTYGLRRAPSIHLVLATTHHAPAIEIGSNVR